MEKHPFAHIFFFECLLHICISSDLCVERINFGGLWIVLTHLIALARLT